MEMSKAFTWYTQHPEEVKRYAGKHLAIVDDGIAAVADSPWEAYHKAKKKYPDKEPALIYSGLRLHATNLQRFSLTRRASITISTNVYQIFVYSLI